MWARPRWAVSGVMQHRALPPVEVAMLSPDSLVAENQNELPRVW